MGNVKKIGNKYEELFLKILQDKGYWCHLFSYNSSGQPCDVIAIKDNITHLIDVKHCNEDVFYFSRIESNQHNCFLYATQCGVSMDNLGFAIYSDKTESFHWLSFKFYCTLQHVKKVKVSCLKKVDDVL